MRLTTYHMHRTEIQKPIVMYGYERLLATSLFYFALILLAAPGIVAAADIIVSDPSDLDLEISTSILDENGENYLSIGIDNLSQDTHYELSLARGIIYQVIVLAYTSDGLNVSIPPRLLDHNSLIEIDKFDVFPGQDTDLRIPLKLIVDSTKLREGDSQIRFQIDGLIPYRVVGERNSEQQFIVLNILTNYYDI